VTAVDGTTGVSQERQQPSAAPPTDPAEQLPDVGLLEPPTTSAMLDRCLVLVSVVAAYLVLDRAALALMDYWLLDSLGYASVFWTNLQVQALLFLLAAALVGGAVAVPLLRTATPAGVPRRRYRRRVVAVAALAGGASGTVMAGEYLTFLAAWHARPFGADDPVFGHDVSFYVFRLPALWSLWWLLLVTALVALVCVVIAGRDRQAGRVSQNGHRRRFLSRLTSRGARATVAAVGLLLATGLLLARYGVVTADNYDSSIPTGAEYLDVTGLLSTVNVLTASAVLVLLATGAVVWALGRRPGSRRAPALVAVAAVGLAVVALPGALGVRNVVEVDANEPVVQLPYIEDHLAATRRAWGLDAVETVDFTPRSGDDPLPTAAELMAAPAFRTAGLWPGYTSRLERQLDPEYVERLFLAEDDAFDEIYSTTIDAFRQQEKLRPYYDFMDVDTVRYRVDGESRLFASAVREVPLLEPQPWLAWWGQRFVLFTHGFGLVGADMSSSDPTGRPVIEGRGVATGDGGGPLDVANPRVYHGEGSATMAYSNLDRIDELDFPTEQGRAETRLPDDVTAGVHLDSLLKRAVFGWKSGELSSIVFSDLLTDDSRVHYFRTPLERLEKIAPFLYFETDPYAVAGDESITWMVNGLSTATGYPYSAYADLGDKSDRRSPTSGDPVRVNYAVDSVKATVDAYSGSVDLYRITEEPVLDTWAAAYPDLFRDAADMPEGLRDQVQYPTQLFHAQFDDLFVYYHVPDALTFFNAEDLWDDSDEVVGPILDEGATVTFSMEPYPWVADARDLVPGEQGETFALSMAFTPESALNLRALVTVLQDGLDEDYGRLVVQQVPKAEFHPSPEQADAAIDQDAFISQQIGFWNRQGNETIRGHTLPLLAGGELVYVEPIFSRSAQNPAPQLQRVVVVVRGRPAIGLDLQDALEVALEGKRPPGVTSSPESR
jgi:uncharacterized membrane protein (UPF0182 family)